MRDKPRLKYNDYNPNDPTDAELLSYGMEECACSYDDTLPCVICGESVDYVIHAHYKGQLFHEYCLLLALLRQLNA